tara:strand:- start:77 stop:241 length:165 start_codon:yes stop_codon:yes gene_type:complete
LNLKSRIKKIEKKTSKSHIKEVCILFGNETQEEGRKKMKLTDEVDILYIRIVSI